MSAPLLDRMLKDAAANGVEGLRARLTEGCGSEPYLAAVGLLAAFKDGFWLRRLTQPGARGEFIEVAESGRPGKYYVTVNFEAVCLPLSSGILGASSSELAVLQVACSIADREHPVSLHYVARHLNDHHLRLVFEALREAR